MFASSSFLVGRHPVEFVPPDGRAADVRFTAPASNTADVRYSRHPQRLGNRLSPGQSIVDRQHPLCFASAPSPDSQTVRYEVSQ